MSAIQQLAPHVGQAAACRALALPRASWYRRLQPVALPAARSTPARALPLAERQTVLQHLHSERFRDKAPAEVFATLLDEGVFLCSLSTMYRILAAHGEVRERRGTASPSPVPETRVTGHGSKPSLELGHHQTFRPREMDVLLSLCHPGHL